MKRADAIAVAVKEITYDVFVTMLNPRNRGPNFAFTEKKNIRGIMSGLYRNVPYDLTDAEKDMAYQIALKQWAYCVKNSGINAWIEQVPPIDH